MKNPLIIVIGAYGSGKSEYAINLALQFNKSHTNVTLVDLDIVNPYFRSRDVKDAFQEIGIEVISPDGQFTHADVPMISPRIMGAIQNEDRIVILDVGGDPVGCRALGRFFDAITARGYDMQLVVNTKRPRTGNPDEITEMLGMLETTSKLKVDALVCNTNLMELTDESIVTEGVATIQEVASMLQIRFEDYLVLEDYQDRVPDSIGGKNRFILQYFLRKPWELLIAKGI